MLSAFLLAAALAATPDVGVDPGVDPTFSDPRMPQEDPLFTAPKQPGLDPVFDTPPQLTRELRQVLEPLREGMDPREIDRWMLARGWQRSRAMHPERLLFGVAGQQVVQYAGHHTHVGLMFLPIHQDAADRLVFSGHGELDGLGTFVLRDRYGQGLVVLDTRQPIEE